MTRFKTHYVVHLFKRSDRNTMGTKKTPTRETCGAIGERAEMILVWMRAPSIENASHP
jgi:hypothetical protein